MTLHLYLDSALTQPLSEGNGSNPDSDHYNGTGGESKDRQLWIANTRTVLSGALTASQTTLSLASGCFANGETLLIGSEQMQVQSGGGTLTPVVLRGYGGTVPAAHAGGSTVYSGYDYLDLALDVVDESGSNESGWYRLALTPSGLDTATPGAPLNLGDKPHDQTLIFWRRCTVPAATPVQNKLDLKLRLTGTETPIL